MSIDPRGVVPLRFDMSDLVRRSVTSLYSNLVTRPTGRALRMGIEAQLGELRTTCLSILDFSEVTVLDYSCADEAVARLLQRYHAARDAQVYFLVRGLGEYHRETLEAVLQRHELALAARLQDGRPALLGQATAQERAVWIAIEDLALARADDLDSRLAGTDGTGALAAALCQRRLVLPGREPCTFHALSSLAGAR